MKMKIITSFNNKKLKIFFKKSTNKYCYIDLKNKEINNLYDQKFKEKFVKSYIDLIGKLGKEYNSIYWWVTNTSAKNQSGSKFFENLFLFHILINEIKRKQKNIIIINLPKEICKSLEKYCLKNSIEIKILSGRLIGCIKILKDIFNHIKNISFFIYDSWRKIYLSHKYLKKRFYKEIKNNKYYVLKTFIYNKTINEDNKYHDSFFGILPNHLHKKNKKVMILTDVIGDYKSIIKKISKNNDFFIVPEHLLITYIQPIKTVFNVISNKIKINKIVYFNNNDVTDIIKNELNKEFKGRQILHEYICKYYITKLLKIIKIDTFTTTFENHPWERVYFYYLKKLSPKTNIIGYQHAIISKAFIDMILSKYEKNIVPKPNKIITTGKITKEYLEKHGNYDIKIKAGCALRFDVYDDKELITRKKFNNILMVLGGIPSRSKDMLNFVYNALNSINQYNIIIRLHPALSSIKRFNSDFQIEKCNNFSISNNISIKKDLEISDVVLYDASSISVNALIMGIPIIHIDLNDIISFDPLFQCNYFKWTAHTKEELVEIINNIYTLKNEEHVRDQFMAKQYANDYIYKITEDRLNEFIT